MWRAQWWTSKYIMGTRSRSMRTCPRSLEGFGPSFIESTYKNQYPNYQVGSRKSECQEIQIYNIHNEHDDKGVYNGNNYPITLLFTRKEISAFLMIEVDDDD